MRCEAGVLVWRVVGVSIIATEREQQVNYCVRFALLTVWPHRSTYGPSDHVKTWLKPHELTSFSASARDCGMVY
jgi:hypothetical protein